MPPVALWEKHKLAGDPPPVIELTLRQHVTSKVDLPKVPSGTEGMVVLADGFAWRRYRVLFDNGVEIGFLDSRHLEAGKKPFLQRLKPGRG